MSDQSDWLAFQPTLSERMLRAAMKDQYRDMQAEIERLRAGLQLIANDKHRLMNEVARQTAASILGGKPIGEVAEWPKRDVSHAQSVEEQRFLHGAAADAQQVPEGMALYKGEFVTARMVVERLAEAESAYLSAWARLVKEERLHGYAMEERDHAEEMADKLADAIATLLGVEIGEHSNMNCPWEQALEAFEERAASTVTQDAAP